MTAAAGAPPLWSPIRTQDVAIAHFRPCDEDNLLKKTTTKQMKLFFLCNFKARESQRTIIAKQIQYGEDQESVLLEFTVRYLLKNSSAGKRKHPYCRKAVADGLHPSIRMKMMG